MKIVELIIILLLVSLGILYIADLWFDVFTGEIMFKITITFGIVFLILLSVVFIKRHISKENELKRNKFID
jgi:hypothetical protein